MYRVLSATILVLLMAFAARASDADWLVAKASQQVNYTVDKVTWRPAKVGDPIPNKAWISTGPRGRAQLVRGVESITFQPNTLAGLFTKSGLFDRRTEIYQQVGTIDLEIEKRNTPHTTVQTPFLAAVVKGTNFSVEVTKRNADVSVNRGLVQVTSFRSGQRTDLGPGQRAAVDSSRGMTVSGVGTPPSISSVAPSVARVPAIGSTKTVSSKHDASSTASPNSSSQEHGSASKEDNASGGEKSGKQNGNSANGNSGDGGNGKGNSGQGNGNGGSNGNQSSGNSNGHSGNSENGNSGSGGGNGQGSNGQGNGKGNSGQGPGNGSSNGNQSSGNSNGHSGNSENGNSGSAGQGNGQGSNGQGNGKGGNSNGNSGNGGTGNNGNGNGNGNGE